MEYALMTSILVMGFLGSWHCGVMCGPLSCNFRKTPQFISYHFGRLISYLTIGGLLFAGTHYFTDTDSRLLKLGASIFFGILFIIFGLNQMNFLRNKHFEFKLYKWQMKTLLRYKNICNQFPIILGLLTGLFPCGWLYSFLILSSQMKIAEHAFLVIFIFWLSALPAFVVITGFMKNLVKASPISYQKISGVVLIVAGLFSIFGHWVQIIFNF
ncbi:MAG: sulfite exporter TauE/SafE family protein [Bdellovibrionaceae bacterium]|nr:sulfite exporter TauE/SafE family protein [Bdellovibrio sp.]